MEVEAIWCSDGGGGGSGAGYRVEGEVPSDGSMCARDIFSGNLQWKVEQFVFRLICVWSNGFRVEGGGDESVWPGGLGSWLMKDEPFVLRLICLSFRAGLSPRKTGALMAFL